MPRLTLSPPARGREPTEDSRVRRIVLGDWHPWLRDPIDLLRLLLVAGAVAFALAGDGRGALLLGGAAAIAWAVRFALLPRVYDLALMLALTLQAWGEALHAYDSITWFDNVVHFAVPFFGGPTLYIVLARLDVVPDPKDETYLRHYVGIGIVAFALGVALGGLWEIVEWCSDRICSCPTTTRSAISSPTRWDHSVARRCSWCGRGGAGVRSGASRATTAPR
jgi:hypothetical protein